MTSSRNNIQCLDAAISSFENQRRNEFADLKDQLLITREHFKPINLLNHTIKDLRESPVLKTNLFETIMSVMAGYFSKKLIIGKSNSLIKIILGYVLQYNVTNFISKKVSSEIDK